MVKLKYILLAFILLPCLCSSQDFGIIGIEKDTVIAVLKKSNVAITFSPDSIAQKYFDFTSKGRPETRCLLDGTKIKIVQTVHDFVQYDKQKEFFDNNFTIVKDAEDRWLHREPYGRFKVAIIQQGNIFIIEIKK